MSTGPWLVASWSFLQVLSPGWWLLRAWVAVQLVDIGIGPWEWPTLMPRLGDAWSGPTLLAGAAIGSVLLGMRRLWPASASPGSALARVVLLGLNAFALASLVSVVGSFPSTETLNQTVYVDRMGYAPQERGLENNGHLVHNVHAYDVQGLPIEGVQLFDQAGRPLAVTPSGRPGSDTRDGCRRRTPGRTASNSCGTSSRSRSGRTTGGVDTPAPGSPTNRRSCLSLRWLRCRRRCFRVPTSLPPSLTTSLSRS